MCIGIFIYLGSGRGLAFTSSPLYLVAYQVDQDAAASVSAEAVTTAFNRLSNGTVAEGGISIVDDDLTRSMAKAGYNKIDKALAKYARATRVEVWPATTTNKVDRFSALLRVLPAQPVRNKVTSVVKGVLKGQLAQSTLGNRALHHGIMC